MQEIRLKAAAAAWKAKRQAAIDAMPAEEKAAEYQRQRALLTEWLGRAEEENHTAARSAILRLLARLPK